MQVDVGTPKILFQANIIILSHI